MTAYHRVVLDEAQSELGDLVAVGECLCCVFLALICELGFEVDNALGTLCQCHTCGRMVMHMRTSDS